MIRMKENYYIKKYYGDFVLLKRAKNKENCKKVLEKVGVYGTLREVKEAIIKEMIKDEVNHRKTEPLYKLIPLMRQMYNRFYEREYGYLFRRIVRKNMSLLAYSNNKQPKEQKFMECASAFSTQKILKIFVKQQFPQIISIILTIQ